MRYSFKVVIAAVPALLIAAFLYVGATAWGINTNMTTSARATALVQANNDLQGLPEPVVEDTLPSDFYILLLGVDSSENRESGDEADLYEGVFRSDSIILAHVNTDKKHISLCSFHRDLMTDIDGYGPGYKLNAAYALGGVNLMRDEIEELTNIDNIPYYAVVDMDGLRTIIDSVGGVEVDVEEAFYDEEINQGIDTKGIQILDGESALVYSRSRHAWDDMGYVGDTARAKHQRQVLQALAAKFAKQDLFSLMNSAETVSQFVATNLTVSQLFEIAGKLRGMDAAENVYSLMTPTGGVYTDDQWFEELYDDEWELVLKDFKVNDGPILSAVEEDAMDSDTENENDVSSNVSNEANLNEVLRHSTPIQNV